jgi:membrane fusion protein (multidrug efflux system)
MAPPPGSAPAPESRSSGTGLFREEALEEYARGRDVGSPLRLSPRWAAWTWRILLLLFAGGLAFAAFGRVSEYAAGPAVLRIVGHTELTARTDGTVEEVLVLPGERVREGQVLVRFYSDSERAEVERVRSEFELQLVRVLRDPRDEDARAAAAAIRPQLVLAQSRLSQRRVAAPHDGIVNDVRIRPGQRLSAGERVVSLVQEDRELELIALLPGRTRPLLEPGMPLRLSVSGYAHAYVDLTIAEVGEEVVGPDAVRRYLGAEVGDAVRVDGPVVMMRAALPARTFRSDGREHELFPGMQGTAEVPVRRESVLLALLPGLRGLRERVG